MLMLETLSSNRNLKNKIKGIEMLRTTTYQDLPSWEIGLEQGFKQGFEQGIEKGIKKAIKGIYFIEKDPQKIANILDVDIEFVKETIKDL